jgi:AcrR family transcriptional regulator
LSSTGSAQPPRPDRDPFHRPLIELCFERGLAGISAELLCERAGAGPAEFARRHGDLDGCFCAVYELEMDRLLAEFDAALAAAEDWRAGLRAVAYVFQDWLDSDPVRTHFMVTEVRFASEPARLVQYRGIQRMIDLLDEGRTQRRSVSAADHLSEGTAEALAGGVLMQIHGAAAAGRTFPASAVPEMLHSVLLPYLGPEAAAEELAIPPPEERRGGREGRR